MSHAYRIHLKHTLHTWKIFKLLMTIFNISMEQAPQGQFGNSNPFNIPFISRIPIPRGVILIRCLVIYWRFSLPWFPSLLLNQPLECIPSFCLSSVFHVHISKPISPLSAPLLIDSSALLNLTKTYVSIQVHYCEPYFV